jgi:hypothetical protein
VESAAAASAPAPSAPQTPAENPAAHDLTARTVVELRALARAQGRTGYSRLTKAALLDLLAR